MESKAPRKKNVRTEEKDEEKRKPAEEFPRATRIKFSVGTSTADGKFFE